MTNNSDIENKLAKLREDYKNKLPDKISEINTSWKEVSSDPKEENLTLFHRMIHSLHGSADTFGYPEIGKIAGDFERLAKSFIAEPKLVTKNKKQAEDYIKELTNRVKSLDETKRTGANTKTKYSNNLLIYLLDDDKSWRYNIESQMKSFGYEIKCFESVASLIAELKQKQPGVLILNINLIDDQLKKILMENNQKESEQIAVIFISSSGEFASRLKAVRLGGQGYFIKPLLLDDLIYRMDQLLKSDALLYRVLIIDDEIDVANFTAAILEEAHIKTRVITKASEMDKALHEFDPNLILIDLVMPDCTGVELAAIIRQQNIFQSTPIIYLSAEDDPLQQLNAMKLGADDFVTKNTDPKYLIMKIRNRIERYQKVNALMDRDNLTGLYNHSFMQKQLDLELKESMMLHNPLSIAIIDLDNAKSINTTYGHQAGDHVVKSLGLMIDKRLNQNEIIGRFSGEQFMVILPNTTGENAKTIIDDLRKNFLTVNYSWDQQIFNASLSAGIASFPDFPKSQELIAAANKSLEEATKTGRNKVLIAKP